MANKSEAPTNSASQQARALVRFQGGVAIATGIITTIFFGANLAYSLGEAEAGTAAHQDAIALQPLFIIAIVIGIYTIIAGSILLRIPSKKTALTLSIINAVLFLAGSIPLGVLAALTLTKIKHYSE